MTNEDIRHILLDFLLLSFIFNQHNDSFIHTSIHRTGHIFHKDYV